MRFSQRADVVKAALVKKGINENRLEAEGFGPPAHPVDLMIRKMVERKTVELWRG
ncbi:MAG: hypothetical protein ACI9XO_002848 [Paraglaciecola sp.]|jgi:hypothetical protein